MPRLPRRRTGGTRARITGLCADGRTRCHSMTGPDGGVGCPGPTGGTRKDPARRCTGASCIPWCTSLTRTPWRTPTGRAFGWQPKPSGSTRRAVGSTRATFAWGDDPEPNGRVMANRWYGRFPWENLQPHGFQRTSPVKRFPANGFGLYDMTGNVWEWTSTAGPESERRSVLCTRDRLSSRRRPAGHQRRVTPVRAVVLPALSTRGAAGAGGTQLDQPHRFPLRQRRLAVLPLEVGAGATKPKVLIVITP